MKMTVETSAATAEKSPRFDFPTWLPPMLVKELRQGLRARGFVLCLTGLHAALVIAFVWALVVQYFDRGTGLGMANGFFWTLTFAMLVVVMPLRGLAGLRSEIDARNVDLLMLTQLTSWRIVWGKWTSLVTQSALLLITLLPYGAIRYFFGGVDLLTDLAMLLWLFAFGAMATAVMLWVSGLNRLMRVLLVIAVVVIFNGVLGPALYSVMRYGFGGAFGMFSSGRGGTGVPVWVQLCWVFDMAIVLVFSLLQAVRRISPPSENHSLATRLLALAVLLPMPLLILFKHAGRGARDAMEMQAVLGLVAFMLVCVMELATMELPMPVHVRQLYGRGGRVRRFLCMLFLPGWTSAAVFTLVGLGLFSALVVAGAFPDSLSRLKFLRVLGLVWIAVVMPAALISRFMKRGKVRAVIVYGLIQGVIGLACIFGAFIISATKLPGSVRDVIAFVYHVMPVTSFWFELVGMSKRYADVVTPEFFGQLVMSVVSIGIVVSCSRPFFRAYEDGKKSIGGGARKDGVE